MSDGLVESWALGSIAGSLVAQENSRIAHGFFEHMRHQRDLAHADADYTALVVQHNRLVDGFDQLFRLARGLEDKVARQGEHIKQLEGDLIAANERATAAEQRVTTLEQWGNSLAIREAEARRDATFYKERYHAVCDSGTKDAMALRRATEEIARLEAIIAGMAKGEDQTPPATDSPPL